MGMTKDEIDNINDGYCVEWTQSFHEMLRPEGQVEMFPELDSIHFCQSKFN